MHRILTLIATTAVVAASPVLAQELGDDANLIRTRDLTDGAVYTTNEAYDEGSWGTPGSAYTWGWSGYDGIGSGWNEVGEIEDVVLDRSGQMIGVVAEIGGFLDIGDKHVMLRVEDVELVAVDEAEYVLITRYSEEELEAMEGVDEGWWE